MPDIVEVPRAPGAPQRPVPEQDDTPWKFLDATDAPESPSTNPSSYKTKTCKLQIVYNKNGASGTPPATSVVTYSGEKKEVTLENTVVDQGSAMTYSGRYFIGWSRNSGGPATYWPGDQITKTWQPNESGTDSYTLYAMWSTAGRICYKPGEFANEASDQFSTKYSEKPAQSFLALKPATFTRTGYSQTGWLYDKGDSYPEGERYIHYDLEELVTEQTLPSGKEIILYPEWEANTYNITLKSSATDGETLSMQAVYDSEFTVPGDSSFTKEGYHISFWNEDPNCLSATWFPEKTYVFNRTEDITLYAIWAGNEYYVLYDEDDDSGDDIVVVLESAFLALDEDNALCSSSEENPLIKDSNDYIHMHSLAFKPDFEKNGDSTYDIAVYGSPFYTQFRPNAKENRTFAGWKMEDDTVLIKADHHMDAYCLPDSPIWNLLQNVRLHAIWSGDYPFGKIFFGRAESSDYGIIITEPPSYKWPERSFQHDEVKGKPGDVLSDMRRYKNVDKEYKIAVYNTAGFNKAASDLSEFLHRYDGYQNYIRLEDSYERDIFMLGVYEESGELTNILGQAGEATITFNCKPQKYLISGNKKIEIMSSPFIIENPTSYAALPIIKILGTGKIIFSGYPSRVLLQDMEELEPKTVELLIGENSNEITIDSETFKATNYNGWNANPYISFDEQIALYPGQNEIQFEGDIDKITIIPRWWRL